MSHPGRDRWLVSYADFITLLFAFFTTLYAISTVDEGKLAGVAQGLQQALNRDAVAPDMVAHGRGISAPTVTHEDAARLAAERAAADEARRRLTSALAADFAADALELRDDPRGLVVSIPEAGAFAVGSADLSPAADEVLRRLAAALSTLTVPVRIEGHTDDVPIHTARFASNWELSTARATRVVALLIDAGLSPERLSAAGYSEFHPRVANDSPASRARNRRVDVVVLTATAAAAQEPLAQVPR